jgi:glucose/arabinose dehydrogenase
VLPILLILAGFAAARAEAQPTVPANFVVEDVAPGAGFVVPVQVVWLPDGRMLVVEKRGRIQVVKNGIKNAQPMWQGDNEVLDQQDRGFLSLAVDPHYFVNHYIYLLYTVDSDSNGTDNNAYGFGRLTRYTVNFTDSNTVIPSSRLILMGTWWKDAPEVLSPSHSIGTLRFARDGSLLVSAGEGADFTITDAGGHQPTIFGTSANKIDPYEDIGAFRSQDVNILAGKILRLNPANGHGYMSNPFHDSNLGSKRSRVWEYGLRNPYRYTIRPGTGSTDTSAANPGVLYIGDVGQDTWEEANIARTGGINLGWPCYEGFDPNSNFQAASPSHTDCSSYGTSANPANPTEPDLWWNHYEGSGSNPVGLVGNCSIGGSFYNGTLYPVGYQAKYFFMDYGQNWMKFATVDGNDNVLSVSDFATGLEGPVDLEVDPVTGDLVYVSIYTNQVRRIRYVGGGSEPPPITLGQASPTAGVKPLTVNFTSTGTNDPDGDPLTLSWNFGDGQGATGGSASHTYTIAGTYNAVLTADDSKGGIGRDTIQISVAESSTFPTTPVLDRFNRANGGLGPNWTDQLNQLAIISNAVGQTSNTWNDAVWDSAAYGPTQEAYYTFNAVTTSSPEHDLMLKLQGTTWTAGLVEIHYDASQHNVVVNTYDTPNSWRGWATIPNVTFVAGDQFGARAYPSGAVEIYKNATLIGTADVSGWPFHANGGYIGIEMALATSTRIDNFGGGDAILNSNTPPIGFITSPLDSTFYAAGDSVHLRGYAHDAQDSALALTYRWEVDLHHNNHVHPVVEQSDSASFDFVAQNHDDGTGVWMLIRYIVTDTGGMRDTTITRIFPSVDLTPGLVTTSPGEPGTTQPAGWMFTIRNLGPMPAHIFHWMITADGAPLVQGDTLVAALDSVEITRVLAPTLAAGNHLVRAIVDTLGTQIDSLGSMYETNENNNTSSTTISVVSGGGAVGVPGTAYRFSLSRPYPNPANGRVSLRLELPDETETRFEVVDVQGRVVWREPEQTRVPGIWSLDWDGRSASGAPAHPGLYLARITANGHTYTRRFVLLH